jgi:hypothetical protein
MISAHSGDVPTVRYFLDQGGDLLKADVKGCTVLHHAAGAGCSPDTHLLCIVLLYFDKFALFTFTTAAQSVCSVFDLRNHLFYHRIL